MNFIAFDFETANAKRNSACSLALTVVEDNQITDSFYSLINPESEFHWRNTQIHGITAQDVAQAPTFRQLWPHIAGIFYNQNLLVAHNAPFDCSVLKHCLLKEGLEVPRFNILDTVKTSKHFYQNFPNHKLDTLCQELNIRLDHHHNANDDALACAKILLHQEKEFGLNQLENFVKVYPK